MTQLSLDGTLESGPPGSNPATADTQMVVALATSIVRARGILFSTLVEMEARPKPWTNRDKKLRLKVAKAVGILLTAWESLDAETRKAALRQAPH